MTGTWRQKLESLLSTWVGLVERHNLLIILLTCISMVWAVIYTGKHLGMNTNTRDMLSPDLEWRKLDAQIDENFPQYVNNLLVVIEAATPDEAADAAARLYQRLQGETGQFISMFYPGGSDFFKHSALLYMDIDELQDLADDLAAIQPFLSRLTEDQTLRGLFTMLNEALEAKLDGEIIDLAPLLKRLDTALTVRAAGQEYTLSWQDLISGADEDRKIYREFIVLQPKLDFGGLFPAEPAMKKLRSFLAEPEFTANGNVRARLTGSAALSHEEMLSVSQGTMVSAIAAFVLVTLLLLFGLRSAWLTVASLTVLVAGLIYTAWFAAATVGELNLISVAFVVLYIGLGADFAIHFCTHYRKSLEQHLDNHQALRETVVHTGMALIMCTGTTAISFYAFMPTDYDGVAELGWISGTGMLISLFITLTLLPALFSRFPLQAGGRPAVYGAASFLTTLRKLPLAHAGKIKAMTLVLTVMALFAVSKIEFDPNTLNLQSPENESVQTYLDLLADSDDSPWTSNLVVHTPEEVDDLKRRLEKLPVVSKVVSISDFIPENQDEKLAIIGEMDLLLGPLSVTSQLPAPQDSESIAVLEKFNAWLLQLANSGYADADYAGLHETTARFLETLRNLNERDRHEVLQQLQFSLLHTFPGRLEALMQSMQAEPVTLASLPAEIRDRWLHNNLYRLEIAPEKNLMDNRALKEFVQEIKTEVPRVSGAPVIAIEAGNAVIKAFQQAFLYAFLATCLLLLVLTEKVTDSLFILTPLLLAALFTGAIAMMAGIKLNFANIIALPLLLGMGIDSAIYILHSLRHPDAAGNELRADSTTVAIILSALTTILSIGNLAFSPHLGTASMGKLLTIGLIMTLISSLIILPSLMAKQLQMNVKNQ